MIADRVHWMRIVGSSILVSIACIDPGNLVGDIQAAFEMKTKVIWVLLISHILLFFFQEIAIDISSYTGKDIATHIGLRYNPAMKYFIWIASEIAIIAADVQELLGMSIGFQLMTGLNDTLCLVISILIVLGVLYIQEVGQSFLEGVFVFFVGIMAVCFGVNFVAIRPDFLQILNGFIPNVPQTLAFTGVIGSIIMPQNIFFQSSLVMTRADLNLHPKRLSKIIKIETIVIIGVSFLINTSIVGVFSHEKFRNYESVDLKEVGNLLETILSKYSAHLWAIGLFFSGLSSTTTGALTGQYLMNGIVSLRLNRAVRILITRLLTLIPCILIVSNFNVDHIMSLLNIVQFIQLPFVVIPILKLISEPSIMRERTYSKGYIVFVCFLSFLVLLVNLYSIYGVLQSSSHPVVLFILIFTILIGLMFILVITPLITSNSKESDRMISIKTQNDESEAIL